MLCISDNLIFYVGVTGGKFCSFMNRTSLKQFFLNPGENFVNDFAIDVCLL
jgi:hypothetical protein